MGGKSERSDIYNHHHDTHLITDCCRLECSVDRLGPMVLSWRRIINNTSHYIATGHLVMVSDPRVTLLTSTTSSTLLISLVNTSDAGQYLCEVSSSPPAHINHWIKIKGDDSGGRRGEIKPKII